MLSPGLLIPFVLTLVSIKGIQQREDSFSQSIKDKHSNMNRFQIMGLLMKCCSILCLHHFKHVKMKLQSLVDSQLFQMLNSKRKSHMLSL